MKISRSLFVALILIVSSTLESSYAQLPQTQPLQGGPPSRLGSNKAAMSSCQRGDCYPETGDLLVGRTKFLHASSTCGLTQPERYCVLGTTRDATKCFVCDSSEPFHSVSNNNSHSIENIVSRKQGDRFNRWWQSENGKQDVYIQFDLEAEFVFTHIIMTFKTFRPAAMVIEKSSNFGRTWKTYGYFASSCAESFPEVPTTLPKNLGDVYCESKYSSDTPSTKGEVVFRILPPTLIQSKDPYSNEIQDLLKITNLRINFTKLHTFGDNLLDSREELKEKYYYALYEMVVRGSCFCHGHASRCIQVEGVQYDIESTGMVHGQCQCQHNTNGINCEQCLPLFNNRPWMPARSGQINECQKCNCNGHARSCRFDSELYETNNKTNGGVCEDCMHNTEGISCEKCKENYWRDPNRNVEDPYTCRPCMCDVSGSLNDAKCDPYTDESKGLVAGRCHCKSLVEGSRCEKCQNGYFNLTKENPEGCEPCSCSLIGTSGNLGCDKITGLCTCKQFVTGRACDQCLPGYFGLSEDDPNGCKPCDCSPGGSYDSTCDVVTGQCKCRPNMGGRTCDKPESGFYCPTLDYFIYEAENAKKLDQRSIDYIRAIYPGRKQSWTGAGYVRVTEGASLEFKVDNIYRAGNYEIVIRYENQMSTGEPWEDVRIQLIRDDGPPDSTVCSDYVPQDDEKMTSLPGQASHHIVQPPSCLEQNKHYTLKIDFARASLNNPSSRDASLLIDSIILVPVTDELTALGESSSEGAVSKLQEDFNYYECKDAQINIYKDTIRENCAKFICSIANFGDGAQACDCNPTGSLSLMCNQHGGACQCKANVVGRKCDRCAPGTWGFGPNGCQPCNCNNGGAKNDFCDVETGQCDCFDNIEGKKCDTCIQGHWRFPSCERCNCNGFADACNQTTGICIDCRNNTYGPNCENCKEGYYGKPTEGQTCKECMCPGGQSGNKFANTCYYDPNMDGVICQCFEGYVGAKCDRCAINYFGNPLEYGGTCKKCECNGNIDINDPSSCDQQSGKCKNCLYNTDGDHCEVCKAGFFGNASNHECRPCNCNPMGTENHSEQNCDGITGQCQCLPNVIGKQCDRCKEDYFGLTSGEGCSFCNCDSDGTRNNLTSCDFYTGQCDCLDSRGGRTCSECSHGYWGDPNVECKKCECSPMGSISDQCDKINGSCVCRKGITGMRCDRCDRGTTGVIPFCKPCGECFDDWSGIMNELKNKLESLEEKASNLAVASGSSVKDFTSEYTQLEDRLNDIKKILAVNYTDRQLKALNDMVQNFEKQIKSKLEASSKYYVIQEWNEAGPQKLLDKLRGDYKVEEEEVEKIRQEAITFKESTKTGATDSIFMASQKSEKAEQEVASAQNRVKNELVPLLETLNKRIESTSQVFDENEEKLAVFLDEINGKLKAALDGVGNLNGAVCGEITDYSSRCNQVCGGAGCEGVCGTNTSKCSGLIDSYNNVLAIKENFDTLYNEKETIFKRILTKLRNSSNLFHNTNKDINNLLDYANKSLQSINNKRNDLTSLIETLDKFIKENGEKPAKIELNAEYTLNKNHELKESDLEEILNKISDLASKINVGQIEKDTEGQRVASLELLKSAEKVELYLPGTLAELNRTQNMYEASSTKKDQLSESFNSIKSKNSAITDELANSNSTLATVSNIMSEMQSALDQLKQNVELDSADKLAINLLAKQESLKSKVKESDVTLKRTNDDLIKLRKSLEELTKAFQNLINDNQKGGSEILDALMELQIYINKKKDQIELKSSKLQKLKMNHDETKQRVKDLQSQLGSLKDKAVNIKKDIQSKEKFFNSCG